MNITQYEHIISQYEHNTICKSNLCRKGGEQKCNRPYLFMVHQQPEVIINKMDK